MTQAISNPLQTVIDEFKNISPEITNSFIFNRTGEIIACSETTTAEQRKNLVESLNRLSNHAQVIGGIQTLTVQGSHSQLNITAMNNHYLATVFTRSADEKIVNSLTHVMVPIVLALVNPIIPEGGTLVSYKPLNSEPKTIETSSIEDSVPDDSISKSSNVVNSEPSMDSEPFVPKPFATQLMVEKVGGLLVASNIVRIDSSVIAKWHSQYSKSEILEVAIENLEGKSLTCKFKPIKEANAKGIIQVPEKVMQSLQIGKGKLVIVKPVLSQNKGTKP